MRGNPPLDNRLVISGIVHVLKSGRRWTDAPRERYKSKTGYSRFGRWTAKVVWVGLFKTLAQAGGPPPRY